MNGSMRTEPVPEGDSPDVDLQDGGQGEEGISVEVEAGKGVRDVIADTLVVVAVG